MDAIFEKRRLKFVAKAEKKHNGLYDYSAVKYVRSRDKVDIICRTHGIFPQEANSHLMGHGCDKCFKEKAGLMYKKSDDDFEKEARQLHGNLFDYTKVEYKNRNTPVEIICSIHGIFKMDPKDHLRGSICQKCAHQNRCNKMRKDQDDFVKEAIEVHKDKFDYRDVEYISYHEHVMIGCKKHGLFPQSPANHLAGKGCPSCMAETVGLKNLKTREEFVKQAEEVHGDMYNYSEVIYINTKQNVTIICKKHGDFPQTPDCHLRGSGCPTCNASRGELKIASLLTKYDFKYERQKRFVGCDYARPLMFDFYLPDHNLCIEYDGVQHFKPVDYFGGEETFKIQQEKDRIKSEYCTKNGINLFRIPYTAFKKLDVLFEQISKKLRPD